MIRPGRYEVSLLYTCPEREIGSRLRVLIGDGSVEGRVAKAFEPTPVLRRDRASNRKRYTKDWAALELGSIDLSPGRKTVTVRVTELAGKAAMDLKAVRLRRSN